MKKLLLLVTGIILTGSLGLQAKNLQAHLSYASFYSMEEGPYIETYLSINPESVNYVKTPDGKFQATVKVTLMFKQGENVAAFDKYELNSPKLNDTSNIQVQFLDQKRFLLGAGDYNFDLVISDKNSSNEPYTVSEPVTIDYNTNKIGFSDIQMVDSYKKSSKETILTKSGYDLVPYPSNYFPGNKENFTFYAELYNTGKVLGQGEPFLLKYYLENINRKNTLENFVRIRRMETSPVHIVFHDFDISGLPSGNYNLKLEVYNKENKLVASKSTFFQRSNPDIKMSAEDLADVNTASTFVNKYNDQQKLANHIRSLEPIATQLEKTFIYGNLMEKEPEVLKKFFYNFWFERNKMQPEKQWTEYKMHADLADKRFGTHVKEGYETDRGRIFLKYGKPNSISRSYNEPHAYPYEIWHYYSLGKQRDGKFVFYTHDLVTNDFELLHSNVRGEIQNRKWQIVVNRGQAGENVDQENVRDIWGSEDYWDIPY